MSPATARCLHRLLQPPVGCTGYLEAEIEALRERIYAV
jgi:hypothetical protein